MKIVYLYDSLAIWGGIERVLIDKMNYLVSQSGFDIYIVTASQGNHPIPYQMSKDIQHVDFNVGIHKKYKFSGFKRLVEGNRLDKLYLICLDKFLKETKPDLLICTTSQDVHSLIKVKGDIPLIVESHANFIHADRFWSKLKMLINNWIIRRATAVVTLTEGDANNWKSISNNVHVIPNIVHLNSTGEYSNCEAKRAIFVGRFTYQKGISDLLEIWKRIHVMHPDWQLDMYGDGELWEYYKKKTEQLNININIYKPVSDIFDKYNENSILVVSSLFEPFGLVIAEAMSCGLPVVAYDCPYGPGEIISHNIDGFLIKNRDRDSFVEALDKLMSDVQLRKRMGNVASKSVQRYSVDNIMPKWLALFNNII